MHVKLRPERRSRLWRVLIPFALVATAIVGIGGPAQAAPDQSTYSATIDPAVVKAVEPTLFTFEITKVSGGKSIGSFNIAVETGLTVSGPSVKVTDAPAGVKLWSANLNGSTIEVRAAQTKSQPSLTNDESLSLEFTATCAEPGAYDLQITAKESRTFSGGSTIDGNDPTITCYDQVCTAGPCNQTDPETEASLQTTVPEGATLGINFHGAPNDACGTVGDTGITRIQLDPLNYVQVGQDEYLVTFVVPGANGGTAVCKNTTQLFACGSAPCILSNTPVSGGARQYEVILPSVDPNIDFS